MPAGFGIPLTPEAFVAQWIGKDHQFQLNVNNFEAKLARAGVSIFKKSFDMGRFNSKGSVPWKKGKGQNTFGNQRGTLVESGTLKKSITGTVDPAAFGAVVRIYTDTSAFTNALRHPGFCYAAVHNATDSEGLRTGRVANMPQRQFMPVKGSDSSVFVEKMEKLEKEIFKTFPK